MKNKITAFGSKQSYCQLGNASPDVATIFIYDEIGGWGIWAMDFIRELAMIEAPTIRVRIHSPGGFVGEAIAIHNALRKHNAYIITEIDSEAASAASFIAQAGDLRLIAANGQMMIHDVQGIAIGAEAAFESAIASIKVAREAIIATYAYRTHLSDVEIRAMMTSGKDVWMNAETVVKQGFADRVEALVSMGQPPETLPPQPQTAPGNNNPPMNKQQNLSRAAHELMYLNGQHNSVGSGQRDQGNQGDNMTRTELIAQLKEAGTDVEGLQNQINSLTASRDDEIKTLATLKSSHDALIAVIGDQSPAQIKASLEAADRYTHAMVDRIVTGRRLLNLCGDSEESVNQAKAMLGSMSVEQLELEAANMATATKDMATGSLNQGGHDDDGTDASELDTEVNRVIDLQKQRNARNS